jgi:hypothetical protein
LAVAGPALVTVQDTFIGCPELADAGIQVIKFEGAQGKQFVDKAYEAGWAGIIKQSPEHGPKLRQLLSQRQ